MNFKELGLNEKLLKGIDDMGFAECMPVQERTFVHTLKARDVCVQSQTGTGKTVAFLVSIYNLFLENESFRGGKALIIVPTRELAVQIEEEARAIGKHLDFIIGSFYGGVGYDRQEKLLSSGVDIIIGTPGRLIDFNQSGRLDFRKVNVLVIDEADRLFDMGFFPDIKRMLKRMRPSSERLTMLYSATLSDRVKYLAGDYMNNPEEIVVKSENITVENVIQKLYHVGRKEKFSLLLGVLKKENPANALIFTNTKRAAVEVAARLSKNGYECEFIIGDLPQKKRLNIIDGVKSGTIRFLVATNVAARGLHIDDLELVVNYDLPEDSEDYVHRIGRTARAGKTGVAVSLACEEYVYGLQAIESFTKMKIPVEWPDDDMFVNDVSKGMRMSELLGKNALRPNDRRDRDFRDNKNRNKGKKPASRYSQERASGKKYVSRESAERKEEKKAAGHSHERDDEKRAAAGRSRERDNERRNQGQQSQKSPDEFRKRKRKRKREGQKVVVPVKKEQGGSGKEGKVKNLLKKIKKLIPKKSKKGGDNK